MFKFDNSHIFTGYLKQMLSSFNLPVCKVYTKEFEDYHNQHGKEDPRIIESFDTIEYYDSKSSAKKKRVAMRVNYLRGHEIYNYFWNYDQNKPNLNHNNTHWQTASNSFYAEDKNIFGLTRTLNSPGGLYDTVTHEYLGEYLRFLRDYYNVNLMSLYNCFSNKICNNIYYKHKIKTVNQDFNIYEEESSVNQAQTEIQRVFDSRDPKFHIYALPVKLFSDYTIAIDCSQEIEMFCGFYDTSLDLSSKASNLIQRTYTKVNHMFFKQPLLFDKLNVKYWNFDQDSSIQEGKYFPQLVSDDVITRWDIVNREQDLKLFIKIPSSCKSSITILEGNYKGFNDVRYVPPGVYMPDGRLFDSSIDDEGSAQTVKSWRYDQNHLVLNFENNFSLNDSKFTPVSKLQLLAFNTGESYPFADKLIEYLAGSVITPIDEITDNIKRTQKVMNQNQHYFKIDGLWEDKMQKIIYDYMMNSGPVEVIKTDGERNKLIDKRRGYHLKLGHTSKSTLYDVLGYVDREAEKWYASWEEKDGKAIVKDNIQNVDIYDGLYDI